MNFTEPIIAELAHEAATTRSLLERVPPESLAWRPHEKSSTLGRLAAHVANLHALFAYAVKLDGFDTNDMRAQSPPDDVGAILAAFDKNVADALAALQDAPAERLFALWRYTNREQALFEMPRLAVLRFVAMNHIIHHRGQLAVYLRLLNVPLPPIYGPTADDPDL
jgi:uncharacterized damage-inducible protein DinB